MQALNGFYSDDGKNDLPYVEKVIFPTTLNTKQNPQKIAPPPKVSKVDLH